MKERQDIMGLMEETKENSCLALWDRPGHLEEICSRSRVF